LVQAAHKQLKEDGLNSAAAEWVYAADLRYRGQEHSITVGLNAPLDLVNAIEQVRLSFDQLHNQRYGHAAAQERVEVASIRLTVSLARTGDSMEAFIAEPFTPEAPQPEQFRSVIFDDPDHPLSARILWRASLPAGTIVEGPAVIEESNSTTLLYPGDVMQVTAHGHLVIQVHLAQGESE